MHMVSPENGETAKWTAGRQHGRADRPGWRQALTLIAVFWTVYYLFVTIRAWIGDMPGQQAMLTRRLAVTLVAIGLTFFLYLLLDRFRETRPRVLLALAFLASIPLAVAYASVNYLVFYALFPVAEQAEMMMEMPEKYASPQHLIIQTALEWYFFIATWAIMWVALSYSAKMREAEREAARYEQAARLAELRALRYQINPHFLFNTLNSLSSLVMRQRSDEAERMILNLSTFFRATLALDTSEDVSLSEELDMQLLYLEIEKVRFPDRLKVSVRVPEALRDVLVPGLILQPLVENAIKYGVSRSALPVTLSIRADAIGKRLEIEVRDDGAGASGGEESVPVGFGVGLANVEARLAARFGGEAGLQAGPSPGGGFVARISMPLIRA